MKNLIKWIAIGIGAIVGGAIPLTVFWLAWSWVMQQVPQASEWAGLIKVGLSFLMVAVGGWATVALSVALGGICAAALVVATDPR